MYKGKVACQPGLEPLASALMRLGYSVDLENASAPNAAQPAGTHRNTAYLYTGTLRQAVEQAPPGALLVDVTRLDADAVAVILDKRIYTSLF